jgi:hypothetical protein
MAHGLCDLSCWVSDNDHQHAPDVFGDCFLACNFTCAELAKPVSETVK